MFALPGGITFTSYKVPTMAPTGAMMKETVTLGAESQAQECSACASLPAGEAQNACKTQFNCP